MNAAPRLWDLIQCALDTEDALTLHLTIGLPPMVRIAEKGLHPLPGDHPPMTWKSIQIMLSPIVEPERWDMLELNGEGEIKLNAETGRRLCMNLFRSSGAWSVVVHL